MITTERKFLKCQAKLEQLMESVVQSGRDGRRIDEVERAVFWELLQMGRLLLEGFVNSIGDGDVGATLEVPVIAEKDTSAPRMPPRRRLIRVSVLRSDTTGRMFRSSASW